jgi:hypothetical protein
MQGISRHLFSQQNEEKISACTSICINDQNTTHDVGSSIPSLT